MSSPSIAVSARRATRGVTFDTGMLIALERRKSGALALLRACRLSRAGITEWWRGAHPALLESATLESLSPELAKQAGLLLARTGKANAVDAIVIASAAQRGDLVVTSDPTDLRELAKGIAGIAIAVV